MGMHTWTSDMAAVHIPNFLPTQTAYEAFIDRHYDAVSECMDGDVIYDVNEVENSYENDMGNNGICALVADVICTESPWFVDYAKDYNTDEQYIGIFANIQFPWSPPLDFNAGMTPDVLEKLINDYTEVLWGTHLPLDLNVTVLYNS